MDNPFLEVCFGLLFIVVIIAVLIFGLAWATSGDVNKTTTREGNCFITEVTKTDWFKVNTISKKVECLTPEDKVKYDQLQDLKKQFKDQ